MPWQLIVAMTLAVPIVLAARERAAIAVAALTAVQCALIIAGGAS